MKQTGKKYTVTIKRKQADLPRFVTIPANTIKDWNLSGTTTVEVIINGEPINRRSLMQWDEYKWFISITEADCKKLGIDTGDKVSLCFSLASTELPTELAELIARDATARQKWEGLTESRQRMLREDIRSAKQSATRERRARKALLGKS